MLPEQRAAAFLNLRANQIDALIAIGGDGTLRGLKALHDEHHFPVVGVPGTIDNDLGGTDFTLGFDTALNTALEMVDRLRDTISAYERAMVVEVMGRNCGSIALGVALAGGAEAVLIPEREIPLAQLVEQVRASHERGKTSQIIIVAEAGSPGRSMKIAEELGKQLSMPVRATVLGYVQRGGSPTAKDRILAARLGEAAVRAVVSGQTNVMVGERNEEMVATAIPECLQASDRVKDSWIDLIGILAQ
jgi:6-phosphofructokinase 1